MVSTPVMLATVMATLASLSWIDIVDAPENVGHGTGRAHGGANCEAWGELPSPSDSDAEPESMMLVHSENNERQQQPTTRQGGLLCRVLYDPAQRRLEMRKAEEQADRSSARSADDTEQTPEE